MSSAQHEIQAQLMKELMGLRDRLRELEQRFSEEGGQAPVDARIAREHELTIRLLGLSNTSSDLRGFVRLAAALLQEWSGCEAVGIRMQERDDYPYFESRGFPPEFIEAEGHLCARDAKGTLLLDPQGKAVVECMCGNVLRGRFDRSLPFFTEAGSFWTNSTTELLASTSEVDRQGPTRNRCNSQGYESVALIPIQSGGQTLGLVQLNDRRKGRFSLEFIRQMERLAGSLGVVISKLRVEAAAAGTLAELSAVYAQAPVAMLLVDRQHRVRKVNDVLARFAGKSQAELSGMLAGEAMRCLNSLDDPKGCGAGPACKKCPIRLAVEATFTTRQPRRNTEVWMPFGAPDHPDRRCLLFSTSYIEMADRQERVLFCAQDITERKRSDRALLDSELRYRGLAESMYECFALHEVFFNEQGEPVDYRFLEVNPAFERATGLKREDLLGRTSREVLPNDDPKWIELFGQVALTGQSVHFEKHSKVCGKDFEGIAYSPAPGQFTGIFTDVTARKEAERQIAVLKQSIDVHPDGAYWFDRENRLVYVNDAGCQSLGYSREELLGRNLTEINENATPERLRLVWERLHREGYYTSQTIHRRRDGSTFPVEVVTTLVRLGDKEYNCGFARDISDRLRAVEALRESEERYRNLFDSMLDGMAVHEIILDEGGQPADYRFLAVNRTFESLTGLKAADIIGRTVLEVLPDTERYWIEAYGRVALTGLPARFEDYSRELGKYFEVLAYRPAPGQFACVFQDVTARKLAADAIRHSEERLRLATEAAKMGAYEHDHNTGVSHVSGGLLVIHGLPPGSPAPLDEMAVPLDVLEEDRPAYLAALAAGHDPNGDGVFRMEFRIRRPDGSVRRLMGTGRTSFRESPSGEKRPDRSVGIIMDVTELREAASALARSQATTASIIDSTSDMIWSVDAKALTLLAWNRAFEEYFRRDRGMEVRPGMTPEDLFPPGSPFARRWRDMLQRALTEGPYTSDYETYAGGSVLQLSFNVMRENGQPFGISVFGKDITHRIRAEEEIRQSEERYRTLVENIGMGVCRVGNDYRILAANRAQGKLFDKTPEELIGKQCFREFEEKDDVCLQCPGRIAMKTGRPAEMDRTGVREDGTAKLARVMAFPIPGADGKPAGFIEVTEDITERTQAEAAFREQRERLDLALASAHMGAWQWDIQNDKRSFDEQACRLLGVDPDRFQGTAQEFYRAVHPDDRAVLGRALDRALREDKPYEPEYRAVWPDGSVHYVAARGKVVRDDKGRPIRLDGILWDISDHKREEEEKQRMLGQLLQAQKMEAVGRLAAGVAHDFNNQLTVIQGYSESLLEGRRTSDPLWTPLSEIRKACDRAHATTSHLLAFSRRQVLHPELLDVRKLVLDMRRPMGKIIGEDVRLTVVAATSLPPVMIDRAGLQQALMNLFVNSRDAMPGGGELTVRARNLDPSAPEIREFAGAKKGSYVLLEVADTGVGMDQATVERMFDPFFTTKEVGKGTGLGLAMVRGFVQQSSGFLHVRSEPGKGTTIRILLPAVRRKAAAEESSRAGARRTARGKGTILIVEDDASVRKLMVQSLRRTGYEVAEAALPSEAMAWVRQRNRKVDLLVTDMVMPEMHGVALARQVEEAVGPTRALFVSGYLSENLEEKAGSILRKPFRMEDFRRRVKEVLRGDGRPAGGNRSSAGAKKA